MSLLDKRLKARESSVEVEPGKFIAIRRPLAAQMPRFRGGIPPELLCEFVVGWENITEADILPAGVGSDSLAAFDKALVLDVLSDNAEWLMKVSQAMVELITAWAQKQAEAAKN